MRTYPELAREFVVSLKRENAKAQEQIEQIEKTGMRIGERPYGGTWSDVTDREIASLKGDIASREQTIARLEKELVRAP
jgi:polyhydroxyalkanoate synthesis regulator phasin